MTCRVKSIRWKLCYLLSLGGGGVRNRASIASSMILGLGLRTDYQLQSNLVLYATCQRYTLNTGCLLLHSMYLDISHRTFAISFSDFENERKGNSHVNGYLCCISISISAGCPQCVPDSLPLHTAHSTGHIDTASPRIIHYSQSLIGELVGLQ